MKLLRLNLNSSGGMFSRSSATWKGGISQYQKQLLARASWLRRRQTNERITRLCAWMDSPREPLPINILPDIIPDGPLTDGKVQEGTGIKQQVCVGCLRDMGISRWGWGVAKGHQHALGIRGRGVSNKCSRDQGKLAAISEAGTVKLQSEKDKMQKFYSKINSSYN